MIYFEIGLNYGLPDENMMGNRIEIVFYEINKNNNRQKVGYIVM